MNLKIEISAISKFHHVQMQDSNGCSLNYTLYEYIVKAVEDFLAIKLVYGDNIGETLKRAAIVLNVDLKGNAYALQAFIDFSLMIYFYKQLITMRSEFVMLSNLICIPIYV